MLTKVYPNYLVFLWFYSFNDFFSSNFSILFSVSLAYLFSANNNNAIIRIIKKVNTFFFRIKKYNNNFMHQLCANLRFLLVVWRKRLGFLPTQYPIKKWIYLGVFYIDSTLHSILKNCSTMWSHLIYLTQRRFIIKLTKLPYSVGALTIAYPPPIAFHLVVGNLVEKILFVIAWFRLIRY